MIVQDILARRGTVVIDPHGDLVLDVATGYPLWSPTAPHPSSR
jgi:hypothetical protein